MQPLANYDHTSCPKCNATISGSSKTCSSCGAVRRLASPFAPPSLIFQNTYTHTSKQRSLAISHQGDTTPPG